jgi:hypothetical protein
VFCLERRYLVTALVYLFISLSLPSNEFASLFISVSLPSNGSIRYNVLMITNVEATRNFEVIADIFNVVEICTVSVALMKRMRDNHDI